MVLMSTELSKMKVERFVTLDEETCSGLRMLFSSQKGVQQFGQSEIRTVNPPLFVYLLMLFQSHFDTGTEDLNFTDVN